MIRKRRFLGLDVGTKKIGIAIGDENNKMAFPEKVFRFDTLEEAIEEIVAYVFNYQITDIVIGLPKNMDNSEGKAALRSRDFAREIESAVDNVFFQDERLTTSEAQKILRAKGVAKTKMKNYVDAIAASLILESFFKANEIESEIDYDE